MNVDEDEENAMLDTEMGFGRSLPSSSINSWVGGSSSEAAINSQGSSTKVKSLQELLAAKNMRSSPRHDAGQAVVNFDETPVGMSSKNYRTATRSIDKELPLSAKSQSSVQFHVDSEFPVVASAVERLRQEDDEMEMPSTSVTVHDDSDLLALLSGASMSTPNESTRTSAVANTNHEDLIELFSSMAMLKREIADLTRERDSAVKAKDVALQEQQQRFDSQLQRLKLELHDQQSINAEIQQEKDAIEDEYQRIKLDFDVMKRHREDVEQQAQRRSDDSSSLKQEIHSLKHELNRVKMEGARSKSDLDELLREKEELQRQVVDLQRVLAEQEERHELATREAQANLRRQEDIALTIKKELQEKVTHIGRMTTDWMALDRNYKHAVADVEALQTRLRTMENCERELQQTRFTLSTVENDLRALQSEAAFLRAQSSISTTSSVRSSYATAPLMSPTNNNYLSAGAGSAKYGQSSSSLSALAYSDSYAPTAAATVGNTYEPTGSRSLSSAVGGRSQTGPSTHSVSTPSYGSNSASSMPMDTRKSEGSSLASLLQRKGTGSNASVDSIDMASLSITGEPARRRINPNAPTVSPFATEKTGEMMSSFDDMERDLTRFMTEKAALVEESERLQVRGLKSLADRTRMQKIDSRLADLSKDISSLRKRLSGKPG